MTLSTETDLADLIRSTDTPLHLVGGNTRGIEAEGKLVSLSVFSGVTLYEPGALSLVVKAGTPLTEIETTLDSENQRLAFEPMDHRGLLGTEGAPTIGGVVAGNVSGPRRVCSVGACRDALLGVKFVDGQGRQISNGGRVMKNVTGYDLVKLISGSWGTLGALTEVSLKVLPKLELTGTLLYFHQTEDQAIATMSKALGSPFEVTGAAHMPKGIDGHPVTMLRIEGFEASVKYRLKALQDLLALDAESHMELSEERTKAGWAWVRDVELFHGRPGNVWRVSMKPGDAPALVNSVAHDGVLYDWGGGLVWLLCSPEVDVRAAMAKLPGHATLVRGEGFAKFHPEAPGVAALSQQIRRSFDPKGLFNRGVMG